MAREGSEKGESQHDSEARNGRPQRSGPRGDRPFRSRDSFSGPRGDRPFRDRDGESNRDNRTEGRPFRSREGNPNERGGSRDWGNSRPQRSGPRGDRPFRSRDSFSGPRGAFKDEPDTAVKHFAGEGDDVSEMPSPSGKPSEAVARLPHIPVGRTKTRAKGVAVKGSAGETKRSSPRPVGGISEDELGGVVPNRMIGLARKTLKQAGEAYERDRYEDALRLSRKLDSLVPDIPANLELLGLTQYRMGKYQSALRTLNKHFKLTEDPSQMPVMMDCARALGKSGELDHWWALLRDVSPSREIVTEGRIVYCGYLADSGEFEKAETLLKQALAREVNPTKLTAIRQKYLLGMLYERQGDIAQAREAYTEILRVDRGAYDIAERLAGLT